MRKLEEMNVWLGSLEKRGAWASRLCISKRQHLNWSNASGRLANMGGMSSQVMWKQAWNIGAKSTLSQALGRLGTAVHELSSQQWDPKTASIGGIRDYMTSYLAPASTSWSSVMLHLNSLMAGALAGELSRTIDGPAIAFLEFEQAAWGYFLFDRGRAIDKFWNIPEVVEVPSNEFAGNVETVSRVFGAEPQSIIPYLQHVTDSAGKAFDDDEFALGDHWVRVDFMRRLGLQYPSPGEATGGQYVEIDEAIS